MNSSFCAIASRQTGEDLIGTASQYQTYVLIECPTPWAAKAFDSEQVPSELCQYIKSLKSERSVQFLTISRGVLAPSDSTTASTTHSTTVIIYEKTVLSDGSSTHESVSGYRGYEFRVASLNRVVDCLEAYWQGDHTGKPITQQDVLICTHGMRDRCCARFGRPFFRDARRCAKKGKLPNVRLWKVSHIGGHRFAPTAISFPDGRYYGRLTLAALKSVITRSGAIDQFRSVYRGWGLLPAPLQVLEQYLMLQHGWAWLDCCVSYRILAEKSHERLEKEGGDRELSVEISIVAKQTSGAQNASSSQILTYQAKLIQDPQKTVCVKASCGKDTATAFVKYTVAKCVLVSDSQPGLSAENSLLQQAS